MRYEVLGLVPTEHDVNESAMTAGEQKVTEAPVVYRTDDEATARQIHKQGGFTGHDGAWVVVTGIRDTAASQTESAKPAPLEK